MATIEDLRRVVNACVRNPVETFDRVRNRVELLRHAGPVPDKYTPTTDWERKLHELLVAPYPCPEQAEVGEALVAATSGEGHDADPALARVLWCVVRHLRPDRIVETGVARGISTRFMLDALDRNGTGRLWSIDLPPILGSWGDVAQTAVPADRRARWTFVRGSTRRRLPRLLADLGTIDVFVHDSLHTGPNMTFEIEEGWRALRSGGFMVVDDVEENDAYARFASATPDGAFLVIAAEAKAALIGVARKHG